MRRTTVRRRLIALAVVAGALVAPPASALALQGGLYSVGDNRIGELGIAADTGKEVAHPSPNQVQIFGASGYVVATSAYGNSSFAITSFGSLYGWGDNLYGQLGNSNHVGESFEEFPYPNPNPSQVLLTGAIGEAVQVAAGGGHTLALTSSGQVFAFGLNLDGQLGNATNVDTGKPNPTPAKVTLPGATGPAAQIAAGTNAGMVVTATGQLFAFGSNNHGQLGFATNSGSGEPNATPKLVTLPGATGPVAQVSMGFGHTLAVTTTGELYSFGINRHGQLGRPLNFGTENPNPLPEQVTLPGATGPVVWASAGWGHSLAVTSTGQLYAFGENLFGQLGVSVNSGTSKDVPVPQLVTLPGATGPVVRATATTYDGYAITSTGQLFGFGQNRWGQLATTTGNGAVTRALPQLMTVPGETQVEDVVGGYEHALILTGKFALTTASIPGGAYGTPYSAQLSSEGGTAPRRWSASGLPAGLAIGADGVISGTPTEGGSFNPTVTVTDRYGIAVSKTFALAISGGPAGGSGEPKSESAGDGSAQVAPRLVTLTVPEKKISLEGRLVGGKCVDATAANRHKPSCRQKLELPLALRLDADATVTVELDRLTPGRLVRGLCVKPTEANRKGKNCSRASAVGKPRVEHLRAGAETLTLSGPTLVPGRYEVTVTPYGGGEEGDFRTTRFTVTG